MKRKNLRLRRTHAVALVVAGLVIGVTMMATPAVGHVGGTVNHLWGHIKPKADARYLQNTKVVVVSDTALNAQHETQVAACPAGWQAIGGGVDPNNVLTMQITASGPMVQDVRPLSLADGTHGSANAWWGAVVNNSGSSATFKVAVICAK